MHMHMHPLPIPPIRFAPGTTAHAPMEARGRIVMAWQAMSIGERARSVVVVHGADGTGVDRGAGGGNVDDVTAKSAAKR